MKNNKKLQSFESIFGIEETENGITEVEIKKLVSFKNHPFKLYTGERLNDMIESIKEFGVMVPIIVRTSENGLYEILSGHNRVNAANLSGLTTIPAVIKDEITDDEATIIVTETNLMQRSFTDMPYSERAKALKIHFDVMSRQGARTDLIIEIKNLVSAVNMNKNSTSTQVGAKLRTDEKIGQSYNLSKNSVARHIRLTYLKDKLLDKVDNSEISFIPAVSISYLKEKEQELLEKIISKDKFKIDIKKADLLKAYSKSGKLTEQTIYDILSGEINNKKKTKKSSAFKIRTKIISKYFKYEQKQDEIENIIEKALEMYFENNQE